MKKYELTDESVEYDGHTLYRIKSLRNFSSVKKGDLGGYIETEFNLSHVGDCWVYDDAKVFGSDSAWLCGHVGGNSKISGNCILKFNTWTWMGDITLDYGIWTNSYIIDNKRYIISNTLEKLYIGDV
jgi:hypothetical protein